MTSCMGSHNDLKAVEGFSKILSASKKTGSSKTKTKSTKTKSKPSKGGY